MTVWLLKKSIGWARRVVLGGLLALGLAAPVAASPIFEYHLTAGPAEPNLYQFALQSRMQVIFPTELTLGINTNSVRGAYTVREALDRLLAGTNLAAEIDVAAATIAIAPAAPLPGRVILLPPYVVDSAPVPWRYAKAGNIEVLSSCQDNVTGRFIEQLHRLQEALGLVLPPDLLFHSDVPTGYVLHSDRYQVTMARDLELEWQRSAADEGGNGTGGPTVGLMPNYGFWDQDGPTTYFILNEPGFLLGRLNLTADYVRELLQRRAPAPPPWLLEGLMELYGTFALDPYGNETFGFESRSRHRLPGGVIKIGPLPWLSASDTAAAKRGRYDQPLLPLAAVLAAPPPAASAPARRLWQAQAALFIRWSLDSGNGQRRTALWQLLRQAARGPLTEEHFEECYGMSFATAEAALRRYLPKAVRRELELRPAKFAASPQFQPQAATDAEIGWLKGDLDRLKIKYVRQNFPRLTAKYVEQARKTLRQAYDHGARDPRLLGLMGLCEYEAGDAATARSWLEAAVAGGVVRPRVYFELARIHVHDGRRSSPEGRLEAAQMAKVMHLLGVARLQSPPLVMVYELMATLWLQQGSDLARKELAILDEGLRNFPRQVSLIELTARLYARQGLAKEAQAIIESGIQQAIDTANRQRLERLQAELTAKSTAG